MTKLRTIVMNPLALGFQGFVVGALMLWAAAPIGQIA